MIYQLTGRATVQQIQEMLVQYSRSLWISDVAFSLVGVKCTLIVKTYFLRQAVNKMTCGAQIGILLTNGLSSSR